VSVEPAPRVPARARNIHQGPVVTGGMLRLRARSRDAWSRATLLLTTVLLVGGLVGGPLAHLAMEQAGAPAGHAHEHDGSRLPDAHHDCPVCLTLAAGVLPLEPPAPVAGYVLVAAAAASIPAPHAGVATDPQRARAPPVL
jgi:hypothetical protein